MNGSDGIETQKKAPAIEKPSTQYNFVNIIVSGEIFKTLRVRFLPFSASFA